MAITIPAPSDGGDWHYEEDFTSSSITNGTDLDAHNSDFSVLTGGTASDLEYDTTETAFQTPTSGYATSWDYTGLPGNNGDREILIVIRSAPWIDNYVFPIHRHSDNGTDYYSVTYNIFSGNQWEIFDSPSGGSIASSATPDPGSGESFFVRSQQQGTNIRARMWEVGTTEPSSWDMDVSDATHSADLVGIRCADFDVSGRVFLEAFAIQELGSVDVGLATETDTAFPVTKAGALVDVGVAIETDSAFSVSPQSAGNVAVGMAVETDTAFPVLVKGNIPVGVAIETDTAFPVIPQCRHLVERPVAIAWPNFPTVAPVPQEFPVARLGMFVELAFNHGNRTQLDWGYTDVSDRLLAQSIGIRRGRADETSQTQPSTVSLVLDNNDGALMPGNANSPYWPDVRRGVPLRISAEGAETALRLPSTDGANVTTPDAASLDITGDIDIRVRVHPDQWSAGFNKFVGQRLVAKWNEVGNQVSYLFGIWDAGRLQFGWSTDGSATQTLTSAVRLAYLRPVWVAVWLDVDNGNSEHVASFYVSEDETPPASLLDWELVQTRVGTGTTSIFNSTSEIEIGTRNDALARFSGRIYAVEIRDGLDGTEVANPDFNAQPVGTTEFTDAAGKVWTINGDAEISRRATRFVGTVDEILPSWPYGDNNAASATVPSESRVNITASGILRRLSQGAKPLRSSLFRHITSRQTLDRIIAYWPAEDDSGAAQLASGLEGGAAMMVSETVDTGSDDSLPASGPLPNLPSAEVGEWSAPVPVPVDDTQWTVEWAFNIPTHETSPTRTRIITVFSLGTAREWRISVSSTDLLIEAFDANGTSLLSNITGISNNDGQWILARLDVTQNGSNIDWKWSLLDVDIGTPGSQTSSFVGTVGRVTSVGNTATGPSDGMSFGHFVVQDGSLPIGWLAGADVAWMGESAAKRFSRLCIEEDIEVEIVGDDVGFLNGLRGDQRTSEPMGFQRRRTLLELLEECVRTDLGVMISRRAAPGLVYRTRRDLYTQDPILALDAAKDEIIAPFEPRLDDQRLRNDVTVRTVGGSSARAVDTACVENEGLYEVEEEIVGVGGVRIQASIIDFEEGLRQARDNQNLLQAGWRLHLGTWGLMRYPTVATDLSLAPGLIQRWHNVALGDRITVINLPDQHPDSTVELLLEATDEQLSPTRWIPALTCSPGGPWLVGRLDDDPPVVESWTLELFDDFDTVGTYDSGALGSNWTAFDSPGNAGNGLRDTSAVEVINDVTASSNAKSLRIEATWDGSDITSGIVQLTGFPQTYGRYRFRVKASGDASDQLSPVVLLYPFDDDWPAGGEIDIWEGIDARTDLDPMKSFLHRANPVTGLDEQIGLVWEAPPLAYTPLGTDWHTWQVTWLPTGITIEVDDTLVQTATIDNTWIPDGDMKLSIQLDAWSNAVLGSSVQLWVDWVQVESPVFA